MLYLGSKRSVGVVKQLGIFLMVFGLAGCAGFSVKPGSASDRQEIVRERAQLRWDALIKGDLDTAYKYLTPGTRSIVSLDVYRKKIRPGLWEKASVESVSCEADQCEVSMLVEYSYRNMKSRKLQVKEFWLLDENDWWYVPKN